MIKKYESCLVYEPEKQEKIEHEVVERIQQHKIPGIVSVSCLKKDGQDVLIFPRQGLAAIGEIAAGLSQKQMVTCILRIIDILQKIRDEQNMYLQQVYLDQEYIFMDPVSDMVYLLYLPVQTYDETEKKSWENSLKQLIAELMKKNNMETTAIGRSISVLVRGRIIAPDNLGRNIQIVAKKMLHQYEYCSAWPETVFDDEKRKAAREEFEQILCMISDDSSALEGDREIAAAAEKTEDSWKEENVELHSPEPENTTELPSPETEENIDLPTPESEESIDLTVPETEESIDLPSPEMEEIVDLPAQETKESSELPGREPKQKEEPLWTSYDHQKTPTVTEELIWKERMKNPAPPRESETQGVVIGRKSERQDGFEPVDMRQPPKTQESVVSGRLKKQSELEGRQDGTQVLRKNIWMSESDSSQSGGFVSANPRRLSAQGSDYSGASPDPQPEVQKQLHFVSFGVNAPHIDLIVDKKYYVIGKQASTVDGLISYSPTISRMHCAIHKTDTGVFIEDLGSANHTFVNDKEIEPYERVQIEPKDIIRLAKECFSIRYK